MTSDGELLRRYAEAHSEDAFVDPRDLIIYKNRWLMFGEENAQQWVISKYGL